MPISLRFPFTRIGFLFLLTAISMWAQTIEPETSATSESPKKIESELSGRPFQNRMNLKVAMTTRQTDESALSLKSGTKGRRLLVSGFLPETTKNSDKKAGFLARLGLFQDISAKEEVDARKPAPRTPHLQSEPSGIVLFRLSWRSIKEDRR